jgi:SAM-dependent methyltransferase
MQDKCECCCGGTEVRSYDAGGEHPSGRCPSLWDYPKFYELLLQSSESEIRAEVSTIVGLLESHGIRSGRLLEIGCGPAAHSIELAKCGYGVVGLDRSQAMLDRAEERAEAAGVDLGLHRQEAASFEISDDSFDGVIFMSETFPLIRTDEELLSHFRCVRATLRVGGLYIADIDRSREGVGVEPATSEAMSAMSEDGTKVEYWLESFPGDWVVGTGHMAIMCRFEDERGTVETRDEWRPRRDCPTHLRWLVRSLEGWELVGFVSPTEGDAQIEDLDHYFMVVKAIESSRM